MLRHLLNSHPDVCCHGELMAGGLRAFTGLDPRPKLPLMTKLHQLRTADPVAFMREFALYPGEMNAVGFKIKYEELVLPEFAAVLQALVEDRDLKVIHLRRWNRLKRVVSKIAAVRVHGVYNVTSPSEKPSLKRFALTPAECQEDFDTVAAWEGQFAETFGNHPKIEVSYEDLVRPGSNQLREVQEFLGLEPRELQTATQKMNPDSLSEIVENYEELRAHFAGTPHAEFFQG
jgi:hypothetical protein